MKKFLISGLLVCMLLSSSIISQASSYVMHTIKPGDTYENLSQKYGKHPYELKTLNSSIGQTLYTGRLMKIQPISQNRKISITLNGQPVSTDQSPYLEQSRTFVPIRSIADALGTEKIHWDSQTQTATLYQKNQIVSLPIGSRDASINGKSISLDAPISIYNGRTFVPVRFVAEAFGCNVEWDSNSYNVNIKTHKNSKMSSYSDEDLYWLSRIVHAEAGGEPFEGKLAVANVIINRANSPSFPNTIKEVIFDRKNGYQFTPVLNGAIYQQPSSESIDAARRALNGENNISNSLYFLNPRKSTSFWIVKKRPKYKTIDLHDFYL